MLKYSTVSFWIRSKTKRPHRGNCLISCLNEKPVIENYEQDIGNKVENCGIYKDMENTLREAIVQSALTHWTLFT